MTEAEWLASTNPERLWGHLKASQSAARTKSGKRKFRLWTAACRRCFIRIDERLTPDDPKLPAYRQAVEVVERFADGLARQADLERMGDEMKRAGVGVLGRWFVSTLTHEALASTRCYYAGLGEPFDTDRMRLDVLREVFGNPFRPSRYAQAWRTDAVRAVASGAYEQRVPPQAHLDNARLAVLADAAEEAGCADAEILAHLRSPGPHVRGCWALDLILGKQ